MVAEASPQLALFNIRKSGRGGVAVEADDDTAEAEETVAAAVKRPGKLKPLPANRPRIEVIHELSVHELTC